MPRKTEGSREKKKKKSSKCKDTMAERKEKTKDKKKKNRLYLEQNDNLILTQANNSQANRKPKTWNPHNHMSQDCKTKRKKVTFDLPPGYIRIKRPQFASSFLHCPKESIVFKKDTVGDSVSLTQDNNSPCNSEEINSQDLFITQKTFRVSSPDPSGEAHIITATPQVLPQGGMQYVPVVPVKQQQECSTRDSNANQNQSKTPTTEFLTKKNEEDVGVHEAQHNHTNGNICFQKPVELNVNPFEEKKLLSHVHVRPTLNPLLTESNAVTPMLDVAKSNKPSCFSSQQMSTSTQTENFFTTERSSYLIFCHKVNLRLEDLRPLDLSLPQRARKDLRTGLPGQVKTSGCRDPILYPDIKQIKKDTKKDDDPRGKSETTPSLQSMPESKSADTIVSSGDSESPYCFNKLDLTQVRYDTYDFVLMGLFYLIFLKLRGILNIRIFFKLYCNLKISWMFSILIFFFLFKELKRDLTWQWQSKSYI